MTVQDNVRDFIKQYIEFGNVFKLNDDGYIVKVQDDTLITLSKPDGTVAPVTIYDPTNTKTDTIVLNPFLDGMNNTEISRWFYELRSMIMCRIIFRIMEGIITKAVECKENGIEDKHLTSAEINILQPYMSGEFEVDRKMIKELNTLYNDSGIRNFFNIYYSRKDNSCVVHVGLFDEDVVESVGKKIRKRTWPVFTKLMLQILGVSDISELKVYADIPGCAKFHAYTKMYVKLLRQLKKFWSFQDKQFDFERFFNHVDSFHEYYNTAKMLISVPTKSTSSQSAPWETPVSPVSTPQTSINSIVPIGSSIGGTSMVPISANPMSTPPMNIGTQSMQPIVPGMVTPIVPQTTPVGGNMAQSCIPITNQSIQPITSGAIPPTMAPQPASVHMGMPQQLPTMSAYPNMQNQNTLATTQNISPIYSGMGIQNTMTAINDPVIDTHKSSGAVKSPFLN